MVMLARAFHEGMTVEDAHALTRIDPFFLAEIQETVAIGRKLAQRGRTGLDAGALREAKLAGYSDSAIAARAGSTPDEVRQLRRALGVRPHLARIDTLAAEYPAETNYLYMTYGAHESDAPPNRQKVLVLGSGCYRIGSSVEFDWCSVNAIMAARELGYETIVLNCNPETVSTDFDVCDRLIFDEISLESVLEVVESEQPLGVIVSMGGQTPNNLALKLHQAGVPILGTPPECVDRAEDRGKFSALCDELSVDQPRWAEATALSDLGGIVAGLGGFPVLVRPSYVLSGAAMRVAHTEPELRSYLASATEVSREHPVVISRFEVRAREIEFDAVASNGEIVLWAMSEHVEDAGVHPGCNLIIPPQRLYFETARARDRSKTCKGADRAIQHPDAVAEQRGQGHRVQPKKRELPLLWALGTNFIREATRLILAHPVTGARPQSTDMDCCGEGADVSFRCLAEGPDPGCRDGLDGGRCFGEDGDEAHEGHGGQRVPAADRGRIAVARSGGRVRFPDDARMLHGLRLLGRLAPPRCSCGRDYCEALAGPQRTRPSPGHR
jgi:hypothetical protein